MVSAESRPQVDSHHRSGQTLQLLILQSIANCQISCMYLHTCRSSVKLNDISYLMGVWTSHLTPVSDLFSFPSLHSGSNTISTNPLLRPAKPWTTPTVARPSEIAPSYRALPVATPSCAVTANNHAANAYAVSANARAPTPRVRSAAYPLGASAPASVILNPSSGL